MSTSEYLRRQADNCMRIARGGFDLATAERLRIMAADLRAKAAEIEEQEREKTLAPHLMSGNGHQGSGNDFERG